VGEPLAKWSPAPIEELSADHTFYVGQAAHVLGLRHLSYRQMHRLWLLARCSQGQVPWPSEDPQAPKGAEPWWPTRSHLRTTGHAESAPQSTGHRQHWTTYTVTDLVYIRRVIKILGGTDELPTRPPIKRLTMVCQRLATHHGFSDPIRMLDIRYVPPRFEVVTSTAVFDPMSDQVVMAEVLEATRAVLAERVDEQTAEQILAQATRRADASLGQIEGHQLRFEI
jgi:hypothetical protein